jgi:hypothetical protein
MPTALSIARIGVVQQSEAVRDQDRGRQALYGARDDQDRKRWRQRAGKRGESEDREASHEHTLGADAVTEGAGGQNQRRERDGVGVDHPLQCRHPAAEGGADARDRHVHDGDVELNDAIA